MRVPIRSVSVLVLVGLLGAVSASAQRPNATPDDPLTPGTFSILGFDPMTGEIGAAVQSRVFSVGNGVLWAEAGVGAVATQAIVDVSYGPQGLTLLRAGLAPIGEHGRADDVADRRGRRYHQHGRIVGRRPQCRLPDVDERLNWLCR